jgi:hypothetical protein
MLSSNNAARSYDNGTKTWNGGRNLADRVSFDCLDSEKQYPEVPGMIYTNCSNSLRAKIQMPSCWNGVNVYKLDNSHVACLSQSKSHCSTNGTADSIVSRQRRMSSNA